jgi:hypothetical protein
VDYDRLVVRIVVQDDNLQQSARAIGADDEVSARAGDHSDRVTYGVLDVFVEDAVLPRALRDVHSDKVALSRGFGKGSLGESRSTPAVLP